MMPNRPRNSETQKLWSKNLLQRIVKPNQLQRRLQLTSKKGRRSWPLTSVSGRFSQKSRRHSMLRSGALNKNAKMKPSASYRPMKNAAFLRRKTVLSVSVRQLKSKSRGNWMRRLSAQKTPRRCSKRKTKLQGATLRVPCRAQARAPTHIPAITPKTSRRRRKSRPSLSTSRSTDRHGRTPSLGYSNSLIILAKTCMKAIVSPSSPCKYKFVAIKIGIYSLNFSRYQSSFLTLNLVFQVPSQEGSNQGGQEKVQRRVQGSHIRGAHRPHESPIAELDEAVVFTGAVEANASNRRRTQVLESIGLG